MRTILHKFPYVQKSKSECTKFWLICTRFSGQWNWFVHSTPPSLLKYTTGAKGTQRGIPMTKMTTENMNYVVCLLFTKI